MSVSMQPVSSSFNVLSRPSSAIPYRYVTGYFLSFLDKFNLSLFFLVPFLSIPVDPLNWKFLCPFLSPFFFICVSPISTVNPLPLCQNTQAWLCRCSIGIKILLLHSFLSALSNLCPFFGLHWQSHTGGYSLSSFS